MKTKAEILETLEGLKEEAKRRYKVREIGVFGSAVRGEQKETSDIDVLVDFEEGADLFDLAGLGIFLEEKLGRKVDIVPKRALRPELKGSILEETAYA